MTDQINIIDPEAPLLSNDAERFIDAIIRGEIADAVFAMRCHELGVTPDMRPPGASIIEFIVTASACERGPRQ